MKKSLVLIPMVVLVLFMVGCAGGGGGSESAGPQVSPVSTAVLTIDAGTVDFATSAGVDTYVSDNAETLEALGAMLAAVIGNGIEYVGSLDEVAFDSWIANFLLSDVVPAEEDWDTLAGMPEYIYLLGEVVANAPFGIAQIMSGAEAEVTAGIETGSDGMPRSIEISLSLSDAAIDVTAPLDDPLEYGVYVAGGQFVLSLNLNLDLDIDWTYDTDLDEYYPTGFDGAYSVSLRGAAAMSGGYYNDDMSPLVIGGNILAGFELDDAARLTVNQSLMSSPEDLTAYLESKLQPDHLLVDLAVYQDGQSIPYLSDSLNIEDLIALISSI